MVEKYSCHYPPVNKLSFLILICLLSINLQTPSTGPKLKEEKFVLLNRHSDFIFLSYTLSLKDMNKMIKIQSRDSKGRNDIVNT